jgi:hypothetical protein
MHYPAWFEEHGSTSPWSDTVRVPIHHLTSHYVDQFTLFQGVHTNI